MKRAAIVTLTAFFGLAGTAGAAGIAYIENNNVQVASLDGAVKRQFTADGAATRQYESVTQTANGHVFASTGNGNDSLKQFIQYGPNGAKLSEYTAPYDNSSGWTFFAYPVGFEVDAALTNIAYGYTVSRGFGGPGDFDRGTWVAPTTHSAGMPPYENSGVFNPTFFGNRIVGVSTSGSTVLVQNEANAPYQDTYTAWLDTSGAPNIDITRVQIAPNGATYAIEYTNTSNGTEAIELHRHTGAPIPGGDDTLACDYPTAGNPEHVTFAPDSATMAWRDDEGVKVAPVPDVPSSSGPCPASAPTVISAAGTSPALGGIDPRTVTTGGGGDDGGGDGGGDGDGDGDGSVGDTAAPQTEKGKGPKRKIRKRTATFVFSASEPGASFECRLDRKPEKPCTSPAKVKKLKRGKHTFAASATDAAGNEDGSPAVWKFKVVGK